VSQRTTPGLPAAARTCSSGRGGKNAVVRESEDRKGAQRDVSEQHRQEQQTEQAIKVRQVTDVHANWSAQERGEHGKFSYQLILDDGAEEYVIRVTADDAKVLRDWFQDADTVYFDMEREVLIFGEIT
jgi:hypothetical protein